MDKQQIRSLVFNSLSRDIGDKVKAYSDLNSSVLDRFCGRRKDSVAVQDFVGSTLGSEGLTRLHSSILSRDPHLRREAAKLFCRLLNLNPRNQRLAESVAVAGGHLNGVRLVAVGSFYQREFVRLRGGKPAGADVSDPIPEEDGEEGDDAARTDDAAADDEGGKADHDGNDTDKKDGGSVADKENDEGSGTLSQTAASVEVEEKKKVDEDADDDSAASTADNINALRKYLEDLTADSAMVVDPRADADNDLAASAVTGHAKDLPAQLSFWCHTMTAHPSQSFPDPVGAAIGYYQAPPRRRNRVYETYRSKAGTTTSGGGGGAGAMALPPTSPIAPSPPTSRPPSAPSASRGSRRRRKPRKSAPGRARGAAAAASAAAAAAAAEEELSHKQYLVSKIAELQRHIRVLETALAESNARRRPSSAAGSVSSSSASPRPGSAWGATGSSATQLFARLRPTARATAIRESLEEARADLKSHAEELAEIDAQLAPVDTGSLMMALEDERERLFSGREEHRRKVLETKKRLDTSYARRMRDIVEKEERDRKRREYHVQFIEQQARRARMVGATQQRKAEARAEKEARKAHERQLAFDRRQKEKEEARRKRLEAQKRSRIAAKAKEDDKRRARSLQYAQEMQLAQQERHRAVAEAKLLQSVDDPTERRLRARAYGRLVAARNTQVAASSAKSPRFQHLTHTPARRGGFGGGN